MNLTGQISVLIVTFNSESTIKKCLQSVIRFAPASQIVVVDNHSQDKTCQIVREFGKKVKLITSAENLGFSRANNLGVSEAVGEYLVFLNPDTELYQTPSLDRLKQALENSPGFGLIGPKLVHLDGIIQKSARNLPTAWKAFKEFILRIKGAYNFYLPKCSELCEAECLVGACMIIRKGTFLRVGGFDEKYFLYFEDIELCRSVRKLGLKVGYLPSVSVKHYEGASGFNQKTYQILHESAKRYHGLPEYYLIQLIIKVGSLIYA